MAFPLSALAKVCAGILVSHDFHAKSVRATIFVKNIPPLSTHNNIYSSFIKVFTLVLLSVSYAYYNIISERNNKFC